MLPRDMQIEVCKHLDMDTRIALGMVRRLKVPGWLKERLCAIQRPETRRSVLGNVGFTFVISDVYTSRFCLSFYETFSKNGEHRRAWYVRMLHCRPWLYSLDEDSGWNAVETIV